MLEEINRLIITNGTSMPNVGCYAMDSVPTIFAIDLVQACRADNTKIISTVNDENTASILSDILGVRVPYLDSPRNDLEDGDFMLCFSLDTMLAGLPLASEHLGEDAYSFYVVAYSPKP